MNPNDYYSEAYHYVVCKKQPFNFIHKYYSITVSPKKLWSDNHSAWIDYALDRYNQYRRAFTNEESQVNSLLDTLEELIKQQERHRRKRI